MEQVLSQVHYIFREGKMTSFRVNEQCTESKKLDGYPRVQLVMLTVTKFIREQQHGESPTLDFLNCMRCPQRQVYSGNDRDIIR